MRNITNESPDNILIGRTEYIPNDFIDKTDIENKTFLRMKDARFMSAML